VRAAGDGYTLLLASLSNAVNATLYKRLNFDFIHDTAPVASVGGGPYLMVVNPSVPAKTVGEFIAHAKANSGKINMGSSGSGSVSHVFGELFKMMTGVNLVHVLYRGGYVTDLLAGKYPAAHPIALQSSRRARAACRFARTGCMSRSCRKRHV
jgi:tripartite-type tricarboxylate transporter receptor subunit TctC